MVVKQKEKSNMKQNYQKKISTLENQLKDKDLRNESLTEEKGKKLFHVVTILKLLNIAITLLFHCVTV